MPAFKPGHKKVGGRAKGTPNRDRSALFEICERKKIDPFEGLLELTSHAYEPAVRLGALKELCSYLYPKLKAVEVTGKDGGPIESRPYAELTDAELKERALKLVGK